MIFVEFNGYAGNQMFQYAMARHLQKITGQDICITTFAWKRYNMPYKIDTYELKLSDRVIYDENKRMPILANRYNLICKIADNVFPEVFFKIMHANSGRTAH